MVMSGDNVKTISGTIDDQVADRLLQHLTEESDALAAMLTAVRDVHRALMELDDDALYRSLDAEARELSSSVEIQERRHALQDELAALLRIQRQEVTLRRLIQLTAGSVRSSIERLWRQLIEMAAEVDRLNRQNAAMIAQSLSIARGVLGRLTGVPSVTESYTSVGSRAETHTGPVIQWGA